MYGGGVRSLALLGIFGGLLGGCDRLGGEADAESGAAVAAAIDAPPDANLPDGVTPEMAEEGRELFLPCAVCHGLDGRGNQLGPSLRDSEWRLISGSLEEIEQVIRNGVPNPQDYPVPMVPMGGGDFDERELRAVASYVFAISRGTPPPAAP